MAATSSKRVIIISEPLARMRGPSSRIWPLIPVIEYRPNASRGATHAGAAVGAKTTHLGKN